MSGKIKIHIVPHTHWDREWYYTLEEFRYRLIKMMDTLLEAMEKDSILFFTADGHTLLLRDYLEVKPENKDRIQKLIKDGRLLIGPYFTQPNIFMSCGEAVVQNLLKGKKEMEDWGGGMKEINYMPDQFGFSSQLPQIMENFGLKHLVGARGIPKGSETFLYWEGVDGTTVGLVNLVHHYINACGISGRTEPKTFELFYGEKIVLPSLTDRMKNVLAERARSVSPNLLGMNGVDHMRPNPLLPEALKKIEEIYPGTEAVQSNLMLYIEETLAAKEKEPCTVKGELRDGRENLVLTGSQSSRMDVKMYNRRVENYILRRTEPLLSIMQALGEAPLPAGEFRLAWDYLLQNHAHDSLCAGNSDPSYREIMVRYDKASDINREICGELEQRLIRKIKNCPAEGVLIRNPSPFERGGPVTIDVMVSNHRNFAEPHLFYEGKELSSHVLAARTDWILRYVPFSGFVGQLQVTIFTMTLDPGVIPPLGWKMLEIKGGIPGDRAVSGLVKSFREMENEYLLVTVETGGTVTVKDKRNGEVYQGLNTFMDDGEAGCCFIHAEPYGNFTALSGGGGLTIDILENNSLKGVLAVNQKISVPGGLNSNALGRSQERKEITIVSKVTLKAGCPYIEFETEIDNTCKDHRLRTAFPSDTDTNAGYAGQPFDVIRRPVQPEGVNQHHEGEYETLLGYHPMEGLCGIGDGRRGFTLAAGAVMEYEILPMRNTVCLTLIRATGREHVGVMAEGSKFKVPEAQLQRKMAFQYAFIPHDGSCGESLPCAEVCLNPLYGVQKDFLEEETMPDYKEPVRNLALEGGFFSVQGDVVFSRLKPAEDGSGLIVRFYNPSESAAQVVFRVSDPFILKSAELAKMNEEFIGGLETNANGVNNGVIFEAGAKKIVTLRVHAEAPYES
jgi:alpha-mannosidase